MGPRPGRWTEWEVESVPAPREAAATSYKVGGSLVCCHEERKRLHWDRNRCPQPQPPTQCGRMQRRGMTPFVEWATEIPGEGGERWDGDTIDCDEELRDRESWIAWKGVL